MFNRYKSKSIKTLTIGFKQGTLIEDAIRDAIKLKKIVSCEVVFVFNKVELEVSEYKTHEELKEAFLHEMNTRKL